MNSIPTFVDRFNRKNMYPYYSNGFQYAGNTDNSKTIFTRDFLPALFEFDGFILWNNTEDQVHCTTGPAEIYIDGTIAYWLKDKRLSLIEVMVS